MAGTEAIAQFLAREISANTYLNIMAQYHPCYKAFEMSELARPLNKQEFTEAIELAHQHGLHRLDKQQSSLPLRLILG